MAPRALRPYRPPPPPPPPELVQAVGLHPLAVHLLYGRGYTDAAAIAAFVAAAAPPEPEALCRLPDMNLAVARIEQALARGELICVYGDYDADGVTAIALLVECLQELGGRVRYHVPDRFSEGYGLSSAVIAALAAEGVGLIVTCDCGVSAVAEVALARSLDVDVVITDHHHMPEVLPPATAVVTPQRLPADHPSRHLAGVGTAYALATALRRALGRPAAAAAGLDLVAIGTIADVVPLLGSNRGLVTCGLDQLKQGSRPGLAALLQRAGLNGGPNGGGIDEEDVAFQVAPRLNAAGRLDHPDLAVRLLLAADAAAARPLAQRLDALNGERRDLVSQVLAEASALVAELPPRAPVALYRPHWHEGVLGIVAGKLCEQRDAAVLLLTDRSRGEGVVGSARAPLGIHLYEAVAACADLVDRFGGHAAAAGLSTTAARVPELCRRFAAAVAGQTPAELPAPRADLPLAIAAADWEAYRALRAVGPFGEGHPPPVLYADTVALHSARPTATGGHLRLVLGEGEARRQAIWWGGAAEPLPDRPLAVAYRLGVNRYGGRCELQLVVESAAPAQAATAKSEPVAPLEWTDRRGAAPDSVRAEFPAALVFAEGEAAGAWPGAVGRDGARRAAVVVLATCPPGQEVLREFVTLAGAQQVVLAYPNQAAHLGPPRDFLGRLAARVKFDLRHRGGRVVLTRLAAALGETERAVLLGLYLLAERGRIHVLADNGGVVEVRASATGRRAPAPAGQTAAALKAVWQESAAFRRLLVQGDLAAIARLLDRGAQASAAEAGAGAPPPG